MNHTSLTEMIRIHLGADAPCTADSVYNWLDDQYTGPMPTLKALTDLLDTDRANYYSLPNADGTAGYYNA